jgi:ATPase subunit of ABC transporter with duplicated ATPase domains
LAIVPEFIYVFRKARKAYGEKVILDDVTLSFLPGAKIGVVGPNGAGKSSVLKIMAGLEHPSNGEAYMTPGYTVGILSQEPKLDETKSVLGNVEDGVADTKALLDRFNQVSEALGDPDADYDTLLAEMGDLQTKLDHKNAWDLDAQLEQAMDALRCPPPDHQPPRRRECAVARAAPGEVPGHGRCRHPRPVLPGERCAVDSRDRPRPHVPV